MFKEDDEWWMTKLNIMHSLLEADRHSMIANLFHKLLAEYAYITCSCSSMNSTTVFVEKLFQLIIFEDMLLV